MYNPNQHHSQLLPCDSQLIGRHTSQVKAIAQFIDGRFVSISADGTLIVWDNCYHGFIVNNVEFGDCVAILQDGRIALTHKIKNRSDIHMYICESNGSMRYDLSLTGHSGTLKSMISIGNNRLASGSTDRTIRIWDCNTNTCSLHFKGHTGYVSAMITLNANTLISGSSDYDIRVWDSTTGVCLRILNQQDGLSRTSMVLDFAILHDGRLVSCNDDGNIRIWNIDNGDSKKAAHVLYQNDKVTSLCILTNGCIAGASYDGNYVCIWNSVGVSSAPVCVQTIQVIKPTRVFTLTDGTLVVGRDNGCIGLWGYPVGFGVHGYV